MEDKHTVVSSFKPLGAAGVVEDGVERSYFAVFDGSWPASLQNLFPELLQGPSASRGEAAALQHVWRLPHSQPARAGHNGERSAEEASTRCAGACCALCWLSALPDSQRKHLPRIAR